MNKYPHTNEAGETCRRYWIAKCKFEGLAEFFFGEVTGEQEMTADEAMPLLVAKLEETFPIMPEILKLVGGRIYIMLDKGEKI